MANLASVEDVTGRIGRTLTSDETTQVELLLEFASDLVLEAADKTQAWRDSLTSVPAVLRLVTVEAVVRILLNPTGAASSTETLGAYSHTERFDRPNAAPPGLALTDDEARRVRRAVYGQNTAGAQIGSILRSP